MDEEEKKTPSKLKEEERIITLDKWFITGSKIEAPFIKQAREDERFYLGDQWEKSVKYDLEHNQEKPALTYNHIFSIVNIINGYHRQHKQDLKVHNIRGGSEGVADILTSLMKHIKQTKNGDWEVSYAHLMGIICGKSYICLNIDYDEDISNGELYLEFIPCYDVVMDPFGQRYDLTDRDYYFKSVWMPKSKVDRLFPGKVEDGFSVMDSDRQPLMGVETDNYSEGSEYADQDTDEIDQFRYRVKECWWKEYVKHRFLINTSTGQVYNVSHLKVGNIKKITKATGLQMIERTRPELHMAQYVGKTELFHTDKPMGGMRNFPIVGFFPYFLPNNNCMGIITQLKDAQREHNKRLSQALHHLNSSANSGYTADADAVDDWDDFVVDIAGVGKIKKIKPNKRFEKDQPTQLSQGHVELAQYGMNAVKLISGVNSDLLGQDTRETDSGIAIARRQAQGLVATESIQDNLRLTLKVLGDRMVEAIQKSGAYSREEVLRLVVDEKIQQFEINKKMQDVNKVLNDLTIGRYETVVSTSVETPTARLAKYYQMLEAIKIGAPIPPDMLAEASDWPDKEKIVAGIRQQMQMQAQAKQIELQEKDKDRKSKIDEINAKVKGELLVEAQKKQMDALIKADEQENKK